MVNRLISIRYDAPMRYRLRTLLILATVLPPLLAFLVWVGATLVRHYQQSAAPSPPAKYWPGMMLMDRDGNRIHVPSDGTPASGVPALVELLAHDSPGIRESAANWLGSIGSQAATALPALQKIQANDPDEGVRDAASEAIAKIRPAQ